MVAFSKIPSRMAAWAALLSLASCNFEGNRTVSPTNPNPPKPSNSANLKATMLDPSFEVVREFCSTRSNIVDEFNGGGSLVVVILSEVHAMAGSESYATSQMGNFNSHFDFSKALAKRFYRFAMFMEGNKGYGIKETREDLALLERILGQDGKVSNEDAAKALNDNPLLAQIRREARFPIFGIEFGPNASEVTTLGSILESYYAAKAKIVLQAEEHTIMLPIASGQSVEDLFELPTLQRAINSCRTKAGRSVPLIDANALRDLDRKSTEHGECVVLDHKAVSAIAAACTKWYKWMDTYSLKERNQAWAEKLLGYQQSNTAAGSSVASVMCGVNHVQTREGLKAPTLQECLREKGISYIVMTPIRPQ